MASADIEELRNLRASGERRSLEVLRIAAKHWDQIHSLGNERWAVYEQVFLAALDCPNEKDRAEDCFQRLSTRFPKSTRVERLRAARLEAEGSLSDASDAYSVILENNPADALAMKRKIAISLALNRTQKAVEELNEYLTVFSSDAEAWQQLVDIYVADFELAGAAFALEELILLNPYHHIYHTLYAEVLYSQGEYTMARKYYARALECNSSSLRALYGIILCITMTKEKSKSGAAAAFDDTFTLKDLEAGTAAQINMALASAPAHIRAMALQVIGVSDAAAKKSL